MPDDSEPEGLDDLERWAAEARAREAADARVRERWLRTQAEEDARLRLVLVGLAEQGTVVTAATAAGRHLTGRLTRVGDDFVAIESAGGRMNLVALAALAWCRSARGDRRRPEPTVGPDPGPGGGPDAPALGIDQTAAALVDVLANVADRRPRLLVHAGGAGLSGELRAVGVDVMVLETAEDPPALVYVRLPSVSDISFLDSG
ncbi:MAG: hypothetical protein ACRD12_21975 [Acidimicrobiales bacterium]